MIERNLLNLEFGRAHYRWEIRSDGNMHRVDRTRKRPSKFESLLLYFPTLDSSLSTWAMGRSGRRVRRVAEIPRSAESLGHWRVHESRSAMLTRINRLLEVIIHDIKQLENESQAFAKDPVMAPRSWWVPHQVLRQRRKVAPAYARCLKAYDAAAKA